MCNSCKDPECYGDCFDDRGQTIEALKCHQSYLVSKLGRAEVDRQKYKVLHSNAKHQRDTLLTAVQAYLKDETEIDDLARVVYQVVRVEALADDKPLKLIALGTAARELGVNRSALASAIQNEGLPHVRHRGFIKLDMHAVREWIACNPNSSIGSRLTGTGMTTKELAAWTGVNWRTIQRWRIHGMPASGPRGDTRTTKDEFITWAKKYPHVWSHVCTKISPKP